MKNRIIILIYSICISLSSCQIKSTETSTLDTIPSSPPCKCFKGIGSMENDEPISSFTFSNNQSVSICGYDDEETSTISEFNVFDCNTKNSLCEYDAIQICNFEFNNDTLYIYELKNLPVGENWEQELTQIGREMIILENDSIKTFGQYRFFKKPEINPKLQGDFLRDIMNNKNNGLQKNWSWEIIISKLEVLSLIGNKKAYSILINLENITNHQFDGGVKEHYNDAIANVEWLQN